MEPVKQKARELLESGRAQAVIGRTRGPGGRVRPLFARKASEVEALLLDESSGINLAVYWRKPEVRALGKLAFVASIAELRSFLQLAAESQFKEGDAVLLALDKAGNPVELTKPTEIAAVVEKLSEPPTDQRPSPVDVESLDCAGRWDFWQQEFSRCVKCYACRASCPMCYCDQCLTDCNQPQWVSVPAHALGNFEWHVNRAMHLAGRCVECGACSEACPVDIPLFLINRFLGRLVDKQFGQRAGVREKLDYALSVFASRDREDFIK